MDRDVEPATGGPPRTHAPHVFVDDLEHPALAPDDQHHLGRVLRVAAGAPLVVSDGRGGWRLCRFGERLVVDGEVQRSPEPAPAITIAFAVPKGDRPELVVQKLTELGVDRIVPFMAARSVVRWDGAKAVKHGERLRRVAREAAMQSRRLWLPRVDDACTFTALVDQLGGVARRSGGDEAPDPHPCVGGLVLAEMGGAAPSLVTPAIAVGPEGGWSDAEREALPHVTLGAGVLRAETAAIAAAALLGALRSGAVRSADGSSES